MTKSTTSLMTKYALKTLSDYVNFELKVRVAIHGYTHGTITKPLLLAGPTGCGKTQLANLLAREVVPGITEFDIKNIECSLDTSIKTIQSLEGFTHTYAANAANLRVVILDEVDNMSKAALDSLKGLINKFPTIDKGLFFIMTTNHVADIPAPVRGRCQEVHMKAPMVSDVLPMAMRVLDGEGIPYSESDLKASLIKDSSGLVDFRDMWGAIEEIMTLREMEANGLL